MSGRRGGARWLWVAGALLSTALFVALLSLAWLWTRSSDPRPVGSVEEISRLAERDDLNVLFILIDTLRSDRLSAYGYERETSPVLAKLASEGILFRRHLAQSSWTKASMASMWTGLNPFRAGITRYDQVLSEGASMPAERLKDAGFETVGLYRNGWVSPNFGFGQGFDVYTRPVGRPMARSIRQENPTLSVGGTDDDMIQTAIEYLRVNGDTRWFLYLHLMDVHEYTYDEDSALFGGDYSDVYDNSIRRVDGLVGNLLRHLDESGLSEKTLVVVTSDHGEAFLGERGLEGHARRVYKESTEVPLLVRLPFRLDRALEVSTRSRNVDIWPTVYDMLGLDAPDGIDGRSYLPDVMAASGESPAESAEPIGISHLDTTWGQVGRQPLHTLAVTDGTYRYVRVPLGEGTSEFLFDSATDPHELEDRAEADPDKLSELRAVGDAYMNAEPFYGDSVTRELGELELNQLKALGYALP